MATKRFRLKFMFWLDMSKSDELQLAEEIEELKEKRLFSQTLRDGIRLIRDLRAGRTDVLFSLFPWLASEFATPAPSDSDALLRHEIDRLRELILSQGAAPAASGGSFPGLKPLQPVVSADTLGDDRDEVQLTVKVTHDNTSAKNFLSSVLGLQQ